MPDHDILIKNATIVDGTGSPPYKGGLAINGERITKIGKDLGTREKTIDARGKIVSPGFIDVHNARARATIAGRIRLQVNQFASLLASVALYLSVNSTLVAAQIELFEKGNGVCLHKGPLPWPFPVKIGPFLVDIPVIVSPRLTESD